jgi:hypothetical protein
MSRRKGRGANATGRSDRAEQFWMLKFSMARSPAFRSLSGAAIKVLIELRCRYNGGNAGQLSLSFREAERLLGIGRSTITRAFAELSEKGFVRKTRQGARYCRLASEWHVTDLPRDPSTPPTNDWRRWQRPKKSEHGCRDGTKGALTVPFQDPCKAACPVSEPISKQNSGALGSVSGPPIHLTMQGREKDHGSQGEKQ